MTINKIRKWVRNNQTLLTTFLILSGFSFYIIQSIQFAHTIPSSVWDEGSYIFKGYLFTAGKYTPYKDFGPWTNQMPVAYFMPGISQTLFGAGIRSARYFAVTLGTLTLLGLALAAKRFRGSGWTVLVIWTVVLNPGWIKAFSQVFSQGMVSFFFAWTIFFLLGKQPKIWELTVAAFLASLASMTRLNVLPLALLLVIYVFWQHGKKSGVWALVGMAAPILFVHKLYWPEILKIWAYWIPPEVFPPISAYRSPWREIFVPADFSWWPVGAWLGDSQHLAWEGLASLVNALRSNFVSWYGVALTLFLFPSRSDWKTEHDRKLTQFLIASYLILLIVHMWAALGGHTCIFSCLPGYFLFFNWFGIFSIIVSAPSWKKECKILPYFTLLGLVFLTLVVFEYQMENNFREARYGIATNILGGDPEKLAVSETESLEETSPFWKFMREKLGFDRYRWLRFLWLNDFLTRVLWWFFPIVIVALLPWGIYSLIQATGIDPGAFRRFSLILLLAFGVIFASRPLFIQPLDTTACESDIIVRYEQVGAQLKENIPPGSQVFYDVKSNIPLLYLTDTKPYLPQINYRFTLASDSGTDPQELLKFGWWNRYLGIQWIREADYIITANRFYNQLWNWDRRAKSGELDIILVTEPMDSCFDRQSELIVLKPVE